MFFVPFKMFFQYFSPLSVKLPLDGSTVLCHIKYALIRCLMDMQAWSNYDVGEPAPG